MRLHSNKFEHESCRVLKDGEILFREGEDSREMYVIQEGRIEIFRIIHGKEFLLGSLKKGDFLGEMAFLESFPRSASARALGNAKLLSLQPGGFLLKIRRDPTFAFEMLKQLSSRIRVTNDRLLDELDHDERLKDILSRSEFHK